MHTTDEAAPLPCKVKRPSTRRRRPRIVHGPLNISEKTRRGRNGLRFDGICGRNAIGGLQDKREVLSELANRLTPGGQLALLEALSLQAQRLHALPLPDARCLLCGKSWLMPKKPFTLTRRTRICLGHQGLHRYLDEANLKLFPCTVKNIQPASYQSSATNPLV